MTARVHFVGICGKAMGAVAMALAEAGHRVTGSDEHVYPPMSDHLAAAGLAIAAPFDAVNLPAGTDVVVTGRRTDPGNPEVAAARAAGVPCLSFPRLLRDWFLHRSRNLVVSGGVGKTTTAAMLAWILEQDGRAPDFVIGGVSGVLGRSARLAGSVLCVLEGDEYASAPDDLTPKFLHYRPETLIVTNTLDDHPDLYPDRASLMEAFSAAVRLLPATGRLILHDSDPGTGQLAREAACPVVRIGESGDAGASISDLVLQPEGSTFRFDGVDVSIPLCGRMNVRNAAMAMAAAVHAGVPAARAADALARFAPPSNRQQRVEAGAATVVTDKATHPASIAELHDALRQQFPARRLVTVIRPRATGGREWIYQRDLPAALSAFDLVIVTPPYEHRPPAVTRWSASPFSVDLLLERLLARGCDARLVAGDLPARVAAALRDGDVVLVLLPESHVAEVAAIAAALTKATPVVPVPVVTRTE